MNYNEAFQIALKQDNEYEDQFTPIINEFNSIKAVLQENFLVYNKVIKKRKTKISSNWFWGTEKDKEEIWEEKESEPKIKDIKVKDKIVVDNHPYIVVEIDKYEFVMSIGKLGELKDKVFILSPIFHTIDNGDEKPILTGWSGCAYYFYLSNKITIVQLFTTFIKRYRNYLKGA